MTPNSSNDESFPIPDPNQYPTKIAAVAFKTEDKYMGLVRASEDLSWEEFGLMIGLLYNSIANYAEKSLQEQGDEQDRIDFQKGLEMSLHEKPEKCNFIKTPKT